MAIVINILMVIFSWFLIGLSTGLFCSWIDCKYNEFKHFDWRAAFKMSFLGIIILIWMPFFYRKSKREQKIRW